MANYILSRYNTGLLSTAEAAQVLEAKLETMDSTAHPLIGIGIVLTRRDRDQAIGWLLHQGADVLLLGGEPFHYHVAPNLTITTHP